MSDSSIVSSKITGVIFLVGFMGCGKTTLGRKLAHRLGYEFIDLDHVFEAKEGMSIAEYFTTHSEPKFRQEESNLLKQTTYPANAIVSTGGGLPCFFDNMDWMNNKGKTFYVKLSPATLADRLEHGKANRPVLQGKHGEDLVEFIAEKLVEREVFYNQATFVVDGLSLNAEKAEQIIKLNYRRYTASSSVVLFNTTSTCSFKTVESATPVKSVATGKLLWLRSISTSVRIFLRGTSRKTPKP